jgi:hypothetical protein
MSLKIFLVLLVPIALLLVGCPSRQEIEAAAWLNNGLPEELCKKEPELQNYGFYRRLNNGKFDFISFCNPESKRWISFFDQDLKKLLNATIQKN